MSHTSSKRKPQLQHIESESDDDLDDSDQDISGRKLHTKSSASQQLVPVPGNPDAPLVTKRTLQNRKAQREFRKRREARVRELEERCRRFDQMGLESNADLQRLAQQLKEENEALKSHVAGLGFAHTLPAVLESVATGKPPLPTHSYPQLDLSMNTWARAPDASATRAQQSKHMLQPQHKKDNSVRHDDASAPASRTSHTSLTSQPVFDDLLPAPVNNTSVTPSLINRSANTTSKPLDNSSTFDNDWFAQLAQSGHEKEEEDADTQQSNSASNFNPILSLNLANNKQNRNKTAASDNLSGSAMLGAKQRDFGSGYPSAPYGSNMLMPMPTQQNGALLNPNPIPFAFNLSDPKNPGDQTWWSQMTSNQLAGDDDTLDEKAQAVAQATAAASSNGAPSPFDLSAFLNGGMTPGGMFSFGGQQQSESAGDDDAAKQDGSKPSGSAARSLTQAEHAQMFLRLIEAKMAQRGSSPYAQLGFQPPLSQQQQQTGYSPNSGSGNSSESSSKSRSSDDDDAAATSSTTSLTPISVYSRLSQHPAFLSTSANELEELVDSISGTTKQQQQSHSRRSTSTPRNSSLYPTTPNTFTTSSSPLSGAGQNNKSVLEVDETAVSKMLGLLDRKAPREPQQEPIATVAY